MGEEGIFAWTFLVGSFLQFLGFTLYSFLIMYSAFFGNARNLGQNKISNVQNFENKLRIPTMAILVCLT